MIWKELKELATENKIEDDYEINVMGLYSKGSLGSITNVKSEITSTPIGEHREFQFLIEA